MTDSVLRQVVMDRWTLSPFEFCTLAEFEKRKTSAEFYFLIISDGGCNPEEAIRSLFLLKGGKADINEMLQIVSIPLATAGEPVGRELVFLPAFVDIIQQYTREAMAKEVNGYTGLSRFNVNYRRDGKTKRIVFSETDIAPVVNEPFRARYMDSDMEVVPEDEADRTFTEGTFNTLLSYVVRPGTLDKNASFYLMLIEADTHALYSFKKEKVSIAGCAGFMPADIKALARGRR
jgi:hypothetical protein